MSTDICVGTPVAGRGKVEFESLIGLFMNTLVLRNRLEGDPSFAGVIARVRETCLAAWEHDLPFEQRAPGGPARSDREPFAVLPGLFSAPQFPARGGVDRGCRSRNWRFDLEWCWPI